MPESQKTVLFKRRLPRYIKRYIKAEKPKSLRDTLIRAKEAEELGKSYDENEDIKSLQDSMTALISKLEKPSKVSVSALNSTENMKCGYCYDTQHIMMNCPFFAQNIERKSERKEPDLRQRANPPSAPQDRGILQHPRTSDDPMKKIQGSAQH